MEKNKQKRRSHNINVALKILYDKRIHVYLRELSIYL